MAAVYWMAHVFLSAITVTRRIDEISEDINTPLLDGNNTSSWYALQNVKSTDSDNMAILLVYVRYFRQVDVHVDLLCANECAHQSTDREMFKSLDGYASGQLKSSLRVGMSTDRAAAMIEPLSSSNTRTKEVAPENQSTQCIFYREMLANRKMLPKYKGVLTDVVKVINHIEARTMFKQHSEEMEAEHRRFSSTLK